MERHYTHESLIGQKLNKLAASGTEGLWARMEAILNRELPQTDEGKRRSRPWWFSNSVFLLAGLLIVGAGVYVSKKTNAEPQASKNNQTTNASIAAIGSKPLLPEATNSEPSFKATANIPPTDDEVQSIKRGKEVKSNRNELVNKAERKTRNAPPSQDVNVCVTQAESYQKERNTYSEEILVSPNNFLVANAEFIKANSPDVFAANASGLQQEVVGAKKYISLGLKLSHPVAIGGQRSSGLDKNGKQNQWQNYIPSLFAQLHFSKTFYMQAEWSPVSAQYTPNHVLYYHTDVSNPEMREERTIKLDKLYYTNIPLSLHYNTPLKGITVGAGLQYSLLKRVILQDQVNDYLIGATHTDVSEKRNTTVAKNPRSVQESNSGDVVNDVVGAFRRDDWRLLADVNYGYKSLHGGLRFTSGLHPYINSNFTGLQIKDRNEALQLYLGYAIFETRKK